MKRHADRLVDIQFDEPLEPAVLRLIDLLAESALALRPVRDSDAALESLYASRGFRLYPTVRKTTLFYDRASDCFLKILHPLKLKEKTASLITNRARRIHALSEWLRNRGVRVSRVRAFGKIREGSKPFFAIDRVEGQSLYDILIREQRTIPFELWRKVVDGVAALHGLGYWFGDSHLSHIFVRDGEVSGFIDIDAIRRNRPFRASNLARDIAGLNHPRLLLESRDKESLLRYYAGQMKLKDEQAFRDMIKDCSRRRWRAHSRANAETEP